MDGGPGRLQSMGSLRVGHDWAAGFTFNFHFHALVKEMVTPSSVLAWRIPGTGEPGGLPSMGSHRVGHDWSDLIVVVVVAVLWLLFACYISWLLFAWYILFHISTLNLFVSLNLNYLSRRQHIVGSCYCISSKSVCLLIWVLVTPFTSAGIIVTGRFVLPFNVMDLLYDFMF